MGGEVATLQQASLRQWTYHMLICVADESLDLRPRYPNFGFGPVGGFVEGHRLLDAQNK